jgi:hypothetical protein
MCVDVTEDPTYVFVPPINRDAPSREHDSANITSSSDVTFARVCPHCSAPVLPNGHRLGCGVVYPTVASEGRHASISYALSPEAWRRRMTSVQVGSDLSARDGSVLTRKSAMVQALLERIPQSATHLPKDAIDTRTLSVWGMLIRCTVVAFD